ncbi:MAG: protein-export chaperone SecB, partial [Shewanellaceae bacterium]|nr:protein-export chaperone SecB [Shewanellaceae bacterium]
MTQASEQPQAGADKPVFHIQRIYTKDISFESPQSPHIFRQEWKPEVKLDVNTDHIGLSDETFEVQLTLTATA